MMNFRRGIVVAILVLLASTMTARPAGQLVTVTLGPDLVSALNPFPVYCISGCAGGGGGGGTSSNFGAAFPAAGTAAGFNNLSGDMDWGLVDASHYLYVDIGASITLPISAASLPLPTGAATAANQTNAGQKTQIVDGSGNVIASTSNALNVNVTNAASGGTSSADEATFTAGTTNLTLGGGFFQTTATSNALTNGQGGAFQLTANRALFTNLRNAAGTEVGTATTPLQISLANTGANGTAVLVTGTGGTFPISGTVTANQGTSPWVDNITQVGGAALALGQTTMSASVPVAIASNQSTLTVTGAGGTFPVTGSVAVTQSTSPWIVAGGGTAGSAASGVMTVQGIASMTPVQVSQATAANLNATVVGTGTFAVQAAQSGNWTTRIVGNGGATLDAAVGAGAAPANMLAVGGLYNSTEIGPTTGQSAALQLDSKGRLRNVIMDAAGNTRGVNVNASNQLSVSVDNTPAVTVSGVATAANQTNGSQKTQIVDGSGNVIASTSNNLNVQCANCSGSGASGTDEGTFTAGSSVFAPGGGFYQTTATSNALTNGQWGTWQMTANRAGFVNLRNASGTEIGTSTTPLVSQPVAGASGGATAYFVQPGASDNHANIKNGAGTVYGITGFNNSATVNYVRLYNAATGFNGCNSATNLVTQAQVPASTSVGGFVIPYPVGLNFSTGISICVTSGYATTDTTNATASAMSITVLYN